MTSRRPVTTKTRARILELIDEGKGRNEVARIVEVAAGTVSKIASEEGRSFDRSSTALAVAARSIELAKERAELAALSLVRAREALEDMDAPDEVVAWSETDGGWKVTLLDRPSASDRRNLATTFGILVGRSADLTRASDGGGVEEGAAVLSELSALLGRASSAMSDVDPTVAPD